MSLQSEASTKVPLDEMMLAMDVVDTLRHRSQWVEQELDTEHREEQLKERLRKIYAAQGIEVSDQVLEAGVAALKEERFVYKPPPESFAVKLARLYVNRHRWGKWLAGAGAALVAVWALYYFFAVAPRAALPGQLQTLHQSVLQVAEVDAARALAERYHAKGQSALRDGDRKSAQVALQSLTSLRDTLEQEYSLQIVNRPGEHTGVWRIPDLNTSARNYYIVVEALGADGAAVRVAVTSEETGKTERVSQWGLRVDEAVFQRVAADKRDDGIVQNNRFGMKRRGYLEPDYLFPITGAAITRW
ncbi:MAG: DUF6384 family protein [Gammaproteobacteria bacterium]